MKELFNKENLKKELEKRLDHHVSLLSAWKKVERQKTKAGKDFKIMSKNFTNCSFEDKYNLGSEIVVTTNSEKNGYISEGIRVEEHVQKNRNGKIFYTYNDYSKPIEKYDNNSKIELEEEELIDMNYYYVYLMDTDFIEYLINNNILRHELKIEELKQQLATFEETCENIENLLLPAIEEVNKQDDDFRSVFMESFNNIVFWSYK